MKLMIIKTLMSIVVLSVYTYAVIHFATMKMIKNEVLNNLISFDTMQSVIEANKSIESFLNSSIKMDIALYNQNIFTLSNPADLYYILLALNNMERICNSTLVSSNNADIKKFVKNSCEVNNNIKSEEIK